MLITPLTMQGMKVGVMDYMAQRVGAQQEIVDIFYQAVDDMEAAGECPAHSNSRLKPQP